MGTATSRRAVSLAGFRPSRVGLQIFQWNMSLLNEIMAQIDRKDLEGVRTLLTKHPYLLHFEISQGWPLLHRCLASECADLELLKLFVANGGDVNRKANGGVSLPFLAATAAEDEEL